MAKKKNKETTPRAEFFTLRAKKAEDVEPYFYTGKNLKKCRKVKSPNCQGCMLYKP